jgi:hypothetical protein
MLLSKIVDFDGWRRGTKTIEVAVGFEPTAGFLSGLRPRKGHLRALILSLTSEPFGVIREDSLDTFSKLSYQFRGRIGAFLNGRNEVLGESSRGNHSILRRDKPSVSRR